MSAISKQLSIKINTTWIGRRMLDFCGVINAITNAMNAVQKCIIKMAIASPYT